MYAVPFVVVPPPHFTHICWLYRFAILYSQQTSHTRGRCSDIARSARSRRRPNGRLLGRCNGPRLQRCRTSRSLAFGPARDIAEQRLSHIAPEHEVRARARRWDICAPLGEIVKHFIYSLNQIV